MSGTLKMRFIENILKYRTIFQSDWLIDAVDFNPGTNPIRWANGYIKYLYYLPRVCWFALKWRPVSVNPPPHGISLFKTRGKTYTWQTLHRQQTLILTLAGGLSSVSTSGTLVDAIFSDPLLIADAPLLERGPGGVEEARSLRVSVFYNSVIRKPNTNINDGVPFKQVIALTQADFEWSWWG